MEQALRQAGLDAPARARAGVFVGATIGGMAESEEAYRRRHTGEDRRWRLSRLLGTPLSTTAAAIAQAFGTHGPRATYSTACSSSALAIAEAAAAVRSGRADVALAVGTDALCRVTYAGFDALQALDPRADAGRSIASAAGCRSERAPRRSFSRTSSGPGARRARDRAVCSVMRAAATPTT